MKRPDTEAPGEKTFNEPPDVELLDTTLRDGAQGEGISFSIEDKLAVIRALDGFTPGWKRCS
ncbi:MAG: hypothetical protein LBD31_07240 [Treponema sp.]|nr:hypothetical protein [Treponema sp.]